MIRLGIALLILASSVGRESEPVSFPREAPPPRPSFPASEIVRKISQAALGAGLPVQEVLELVQRESNFDPTVIHQNRNGSLDWGLFQENDSVIQELGIEDPLDLDTNLRVGIDLLRRYFQDSGGDWEETLCLYAHPYSCNTY